jgi:hypothetical protein
MTPALDRRRRIRASRRAAQPSCPRLRRLQAATITANANIIGAQGIEAANGAINLGNPDGTTYEPGITIGGGGRANGKSASGKFRMAKIQLGSVRSSIILAAAALINSGRWRPR